MYYFQAEIIVNMDHGFSNSLPIRTWKKLLVSYVALLLIIFSTSFLINVFLSPEACNEVLQFPMLVNMDGDLKTKVACLICITILYNINKSFGETIMEQAAIFACCYGGWYFGYIATQEYVFQDSNEDCLTGINRNLHKHLSFAMMNFFIWIIGTLVECLIKSCSKIFNWIITLGKLCI